MNGILSGKRILVTGGTGSLGNRLVRRRLHGDLGRPDAVIVFSRDETKQHVMRLALAELGEATDEIIFSDWQKIVRFHIGDVADETSVRFVMRGADIVFNATALKQVPTCEYFPARAVRTNILGPEQIIRAIRDQALPVETVIGISRHQTSTRAARATSAGEVSDEVMPTASSAAAINSRPRSNE